MKHAVREQASVVPFRNHHRPGPGELPGIEGFYVLTGDGILGRYQADGGFREEPDLTRTLSAKLTGLLQMYRSGETDGLAIGLVTPSTPDRRWQAASLVFGNSTLREVFRTGNEPNASLTAFQKRNKVKSVYQGMELVLETRRSSQPRQPQFCPVLFVPEISSERLCQRYDMAMVDRRKVLEVLDLMAAVPPEEQTDPALSGMVAEMLGTQISPELRRASGLMLMEDSGTSSAATAAVADAGYNPWEDEPEDRNTCFADGDPVTYWVLAWFAPFNELNDMQRQFIARGHTVSRKRAGTTLIERGSREDVSIYLIEGTLELEAFDGRTMTIVGGTRRAHLPVSQLKPHAYTVRAATDVTLILVSQDMVREITRIATTYKSRPGIEVSEQDPLPESIIPWVSGEPGAQQS